MALAGTVDMAIGTGAAVLKVLRPMAGDVAILTTITGDLRNVPRLNGTVTMSIGTNEPELITPNVATDQDELRRRVIKTDVWEFPRRKIEQLL